MKIAARALLLVFFIAVVASPNESTALLRGVVLDQAGAGVSGATVRLISLGKVREAKVNEAGKFEFVDLPFGTYDLTILQPGFAPYSVENLHVSSSEPAPLSITLQVNLSSCGLTPIPSYERRTDETNLAGTVSDLADGYLEHASVKVTLLKTGRTHVAITGKRGEFQFKGLEPGKYTLSVNHPQYSYFGSAIDFWIASENLTRFNTIYLLNNKAHQIVICQ